MHACVVAGVDVGPALYTLLMCGWLILGLWPLMVLTLAVWSVLLVRVAVASEYSRP